MSEKKQMVASFGVKPHRADHSVVRQLECPRCRVRVRREGKITYSCPRCGEKMRDW